jgi:hypothetical protein
MKTYTFTTIHDPLAQGLNDTVPVGIMMRARSSAGTKAASIPTTGSSTVAVASPPSTIPWAAATTAALSRLL